MSNKYEGHTPGPWRRTAFVDEQCDISAESWIGLATVNGNFEEEPLAKQGRANARLIADAPLLLAQRDRLAASLRECELFIRVLGLDSPPAAKVAAEARAALAEYEKEQA